MNLLLLCANTARHTGTVDTHIRAFKKYSQHNVVTLDSSAAGKIDFDVELFDAIVFHYSIIISLPQFLSDELAQSITAFGGPKVLLKHSLICMPHMLVFLNSSLTIVKKPLEQRRRNTRLCIST